MQSRRLQRLQIPRSNTMTFTKHTAARPPVRGFTLIEMLMVVAIIGILSSIVIVAMREARLKAADAAVRQQAYQLRTVMEQERTNTGSYAGIKTGGAWKNAGDQCLTGFTSSQFSTKATEICAELVAASTGMGGCTTSCVYFSNTSPNSNEKYTIMAYLPYESSKVAPAVRFLCIGSSGNQSISVGGTGGWLEDGCFADP